jgi:hypothetical protein
MSKSKIKTISAPQGEGKYRYRNITGSIIYLPSLDGGSPTFLRLDHGEVFESTDAFHSEWLYGRLSLFFPDGRESILK